MDRYGVLLQETRVGQWATQPTRWENTNLALVKHLLLCQIAIHGRIFVINQELIREFIRYEDHI